MARSARDLALALDVLAGPDPWSEGIGYRLALPPPRHQHLADYRVLLLDAHPLCPTAAAVTAPLNRLGERLSGLGCRVSRRSPSKRPPFPRDRWFESGSLQRCVR
jgi:amidase